ncbi:DUF3667 domain-containing protein [Sphingomonas kaistensis]|uniref:DUF3667 domain-containing protein n=1 Tax=Sphingomonas kaistensis TaxID=298708 RepID=A0ABZ2G0S4_9SPHN
MNVVEPIADAVTGGIAARSVEPQTGVDGTGHTTERACLNCGAALVGAYCHNCGQHAHVHRSLGAFGHDLLHGVFHFEGKIWRTLPMLAWRPGELTRRYIAGERASFVSPVALFLFSVFVMFAVISALGGPVAIGGKRPTPTERSQAAKDFVKQREVSLGQFEQLRAERARLAAAGASTAEIDRRIADQQRDLQLEREIYETAMAVAGGDVDAPALEEPANVTQAGGGDGSDSWFERAYQKAKKNPSLLFYKLQTNGYKYSWALIPLSVPFLWLLFLHRRRYRRYRAYDHTVFVTYSITFMSLGFIILTLLRPLGLSGQAALMAMTVIPPIHIYRQLRGAYELTRLSALWRTVAVLFFAMLASGLFGMLLLLLGVLG